jgi:hypothetical protein
MKKISLMVLTALALNAGPDAQDAETNLKEKGIALNTPVSPGANYKNAVRTSNLNGPTRFYHPVSDQVTARKSAVGRIDCNAQMTIGQIPRGTAGSDTSPESVLPCKSCCPKQETPWKAIPAKNNGTTQKLLLTKR